VETGIVLAMPSKKAINRPELISFFGTNLAVGAAFSVQTQQEIYS